MASINRVGSPMDVLDESLDAVIAAPEKVAKRKRMLEAKQRTKSRILFALFKYCMVTK